MIYIERERENYICIYIYICVYIYIYSTEGSVGMDRPAPVWQLVLWSLQYFSDLPARNKLMSFSPRRLTLRCGDALARAHACEPRA